MRSAGREPSSIYLVQCGDEAGPVKIGHADNLEQRLIGLQTGCPYPLTLFARLPVESPRLTEGRLHAAFREHQMQGEWFGFVPELRELGDAMNRLTVRWIIECRAGTWDGRLPEITDDMLPSWSRPQPVVALPRLPAEKQARTFIWRGKVRPM